MRTEMHDAKVYSIRVISNRKVVFTFDLRDNEALRDADVIRRSMAGYMLAYPTVSQWEATYFGDDWLVITVIGIVNTGTVFDAYL